MAELEEFKAQAEVEEQNTALAMRAREAWSKGDLGGDVVLAFVVAVFIVQRASSFHCLPQNHIHSTGFHILFLICRFSFLGPHRKTTRPTERPRPDESHYRQRSRASALIPCHLS